MTRRLPRQVPLSFALLFLLLLPLAGVAVPGRAAAGPKPFAPGEKLTFNLQYGPIQAGTATMSVSGIGRIGSVPCYHFTSYSRSAPFFDTIYPVRDLVESYADTATLVTWRIEKHLREDDYRLDTVVRLDPPRRRAVYEDGQALAVDARVRDPLAAFFYARTLPLEVGQTYTLPSHGDRKTYNVLIKVLRREVVTVPRGTYRCLALEPQLKSTGVFRQTGKMTVWVTDDARHMPVKLSSKVAVGSVVGVLVSTEGIDASP